MGNISELREHAHQINEAYSKEEYFETLDEPEKKEGKKTLNFKLQTNSKEKIITYVLGILSYVGSFYVFGRFFLWTEYVSKPYKVSYEKGLIDVTVQLMKGQVGVLVLSMLFAGLVSFALVHRYIKRITQIDDKKIKRSKSGKYGTNDYLNNDGKLLSKTCLITDTDHPEGVPLCTYKGNLYCIPNSPRFDQFSNSNIAIIGSSGSGKSFGAIEPLILQRVAQGESFIATDTKGALYNDHAEKCRQMGYEVKVFNTTRPIHSDGWNCLRDIIEADETQVYDLINAFTAVVMESTGVAKAGNFWEDNARDLFRLLLFFVCRSDACEGKRSMDTLIKIVQEGSETITKALTLLADSTQNQSTKINAQSFIHKREAVAEDTLNGLNTKLQIFRTPTVAAALSCDDIDFEQAVHKKTAIFLITPDSQSSYDVIATLFMTMSYIKILSIADSVQYGGKLKRPFWLILDELCNMAPIPDLSRKMATNRSRKLNIAFAIQSLTQLEEKYGKLYEAILGNCATLMYFGCEDEPTAKYISLRAGSFTQVVASNAYEKPTLFSKMYIPLRKREMVKEEKCELISASEATHFGGGDVLVFIKGKNVLKGKAYGVPSHPLSAISERANWQSLEPLWYIKFIQEHKEFEVYNEEQFIPSKHELNPVEISFKPAGQAKEDIGFSIVENTEGFISLREKIGLTEISENTNDINIFQEENAFKYKKDDDPLEIQRYEQPEEPKEETKQFELEDFEIIDSSDDEDNLF